MDMAKESTQQVCQFSDDYELWNLHPFM